MALPFKERETNGQWLGPTVCPNWLWETLTGKQGPGGGGELGGGGVAPPGIKSYGLVQRCFQEGVRATKQGP